MKSIIRFSEKTLIVLLLTAISLFVGCTKDGPADDANVMTKTFQPADISWSSTSDYGTNYKVATLIIPQLTSSIVDNGIVLVYGGFMFGVPWTALPVSFFESGVTNSFFFSVKTGAVVLRYSKSNNATSGSPSIAFKVVIVPGNNIPRPASPSLDYTDYKAVCEYYGIRK
ncbi:MAG: hypothetical protein KF829_06880 [Ferruginibacter sp.]|nr:hypothetical protein [Ferruginibacter sp.]